MSFYTWFAAGLGLVLGCASHPAAKSADGGAHSIDAGVTLLGDHDSAVHDAAAKPALSDAAQAPQPADGAVRTISDAGLDASQPDANWMSPLGSGGWTELRGDTVGHGTQSQPLLRKELKATLSGVPGYKIGRAFVLTQFTGSIQTTLLVELTNVSETRHCGISATPVWKTSAGQVLASSASSVTLRGSSAQVLNPDGSLNRNASDCLAPAELGYLTVNEVAHASDVPLYESAASIGLTLSHYTTGIAQPGFLLAPESYAVQPSADADIDTVTVTLSNEGSASAPVGLGTGVIYLLLDEDGLPLQVGYMAPRARTPVAAHGSMEASADVLLFGTSQHMLIDVCMTGCPY